MQTIVSNIRTVISATIFLGVMCHAETVPHSGEITADTVWSAADIHRVVDHLRVAEGVTLTIQPGAVVQFNWQLGLTVDGNLVASGTEDHPILFTSDEDDTGLDGVLGTEDDVDTNGNGPSEGRKGAWQQVLLTETASNVVMEHLEFRFSGGWNGVPTVEVTGGEPILRECVFVGSNGVAVGVENSDPILDGCVFRDGRYAAITLDLVSNPSAAGLIFENNQVNGAVIDAGELPGNTVWNDPDLPLQLSGSITVPEGITLTLAAGQVVKGRSTTPDRILVHGTLITEGTAERPVVFTENRDDSAGGDTNNDGSASAPTHDGWGGITLNSTSTGNVLRQTEIRYTGRGGGHGLHVEGAELTMTGGAIRSHGSYSAGLRIDASDPIVNGVTFTGNLGASISLDLGSNPDLAGTVFEDTRWNGLWLDSGELPGDMVWDESDVVTVLTGPVTIPEGVTLRIENGQIVKGRTHTQDRLIVNGSLTVSGNPGKPVIFTDVADDTAGGKTHSIGTSIPPRGGWAGLVFDSGSSGNLLEYLEIRYPGRDGYPGILADGSEVTVINCLIADSGANGITARNAAVLSITNCLLINSLGSGIRAETGATVTAINNTIDGDGYSTLNTGVSIAAATVILTNNLITNNVFAGIAGSNSSTLTASNNGLFNPDASKGDYHEIEDQTGLNGNFSGDPRYVMRADRRFDLLSGSPAIDRGTSEDAPDTDFLGNPRYDDPGIANLGTGTEPYFDIGALERQDVSDPVNLVVKSTETDESSVSAGDDVTVRWTVTNNELLSADGDWVDSVFASNDPIWDFSDRLVGELPHSGGLDPGADYDAELSIRAPPSVGGTLYLIVRVDGRQDLRESVELDNDASASLEVTVPEITIGTATMGRLDGVGDSRIYRFTVSPGETLTVSMDSAATSGSTALYVSRGAIPSSSGFDYRNSEGSQPDQDLVIPTTRAGEYYLLVVGESGAAAGADFTINASVAAMGLVEVRPREAANASPVTLRITGTRFAANATARLISGSGAEITATEIDSPDGSTIFATFDLTGLSAGIYDLAVESGGVTDVIENEFTVIEGESGKLELRVSVPPGLRIGWDGQLTVLYRNIGKSDLKAPLIVVSAEGALLRFPGEPDFVHSKLQFHGIGRSGPAGVLAPGESGHMSLEFRALNNSLAAQFYVQHVVESEAPIDWSSQKELLRPPSVDPEAWDAIWENFLDSAGSTIGGFEALLAENASYLSRHGTYVSDAGRLLAFELKQASNGFLFKTLGHAVDLAVSSPGIPLVFGRTFMQQLPGRYDQSILGRGWIHGWDFSVRSHDQGNLTVQAGGVFRAFRLQPDGTYLSEKGDPGILAKVSDHFELEDSHGVRIVFRSDGRAEYLEDIHGNRVSFSYEDGQLSLISHSSGDTIDFDYGANGRLNEATTSTGMSARYFYDYTGEHLVRVETASGVTRYEYNTDGAPPLRHSLVAITSPDGSRGAYHHDSHGRVIRTTVNGDVLERHYEYGPAASVEVLDAFGARTRLEYDEQGRLIRVTDPAGRVAGQDYDGLGRLLRITGPGKEQSGFQYRGENPLPYQVIGYLGEITRFTYEPSFQRLSVLTDPTGNIYRHTYDANGNPATLQHPDGRAEQMEYNDQGLMVERINRRDESTQYEYDAQGRLVRKVFADDSEVTFSYNPRGNLVEATSHAGSVTMAYDDADRLTRISYPGDRYLDYAYNDGGQRIRMATHDGYETNYAYDGVGRLVRVSDSADQAIAVYEYDAAGRLSRKQLGNGTYTEIEYDPSGQVSTLENRSSGGEILSRYQYVYDQSGNRTTVMTPEGDWAYEYDSGAQLTKATSPDASVREYVYDEAGNRLSVAVDGTVTSYNTGPANRYESSGGADLTYDPEGNLIEIVEGSERWTFSYDFENRLTEVETPGGTATYEYDALGNRTATTVDGVRSEYLCDPMGNGRVVAEYGPSGSVVRRYRYGRNLLSLETPGIVGPHYYLFDALGNTSEITNAEEEVVNHYAYLPFGKTSSATEGIENPFQYSGERGVQRGPGDLYLMPMRAYHSLIGRFVQEDPLFFQGDINLYAYGRNNPISNTDSTGLLEDSQKVTAVGLGASVVDLAVATHGKNVAASKMLKVLATPGGPPKWSIWRHASAYQNARTGMVGSGLGLGLSLLSAGLGEAGGKDGFISERTAEGLSFITGAGGYALSVQGAYASGELLLTLSGAGLYTTSMAAIGSFSFGWSVGSLINEHVPWVKKNTTDNFLKGIEWVESAWKKVREWVPWLASLDPNDILGPAGFGDAHYLGPESILPYTIRFENQSTASAPAFDVFISNPLDDDMDVATLELGSFGFGGRVVEIPRGLDGFTRVVETTNPDGSPLLLKVQAGFDAETRVLKWEFHSLDPETGLPPTDPFAGFLPPNDETHRGEGFVTYLIRPFSTAVTGTRIDNAASIVFDVNDPIETPAIFNTIDGDAPSSQIVALPARSSSTFVVQWQGDDGAGSGVASYDVYVSENGGDWTPWLTGTEETSAEFEGSSGTTYAFYVHATDALGFASPVAPTAQAQTIAGVSYLVNISNRGGVGTGPNIMIPGFVLNGTGTKQVLVRAIGPTLGDFGVQGVLEDPELSVVSGGTEIDANDNWGEASNAAELAAAATRVGAFPLEATSGDAATLLDLDPGSYTVKVSGVASGTGVALVEVYDADDTDSPTVKLVNISNRGIVGTGASVMIPGFVVGGEVPKSVLIRGVGPKLADFGVQGVLENPILTVYSGEDELVTNDDWSDAANATELAAAAVTVGAFALESGSQDAAVLVTLDPGTYTVKVSGVGETTGVALVEIYEVE
jgi:RHS repeat-associated protein